VFLNLFYSIAPFSVVGPEPDYRSRLRKDSAIIFPTRIPIRSQKFVKKRTRIWSHFSNSAVAGVCVVIF